MMWERVMDCICRIQREKEMSRRIPGHVLFTELMRGLKGESQEDVEKALKDLEEARRIKTGRTINDRWIAVRGEEDTPHGQGAQGDPQED